MRTHSDIDLMIERQQALKITVDFIKLLPNISEVHCKLAKFARQLPNFEAKFVANARSLK